MKILERPGGRTDPAPASAAFAVVLVTALLLLGSGLAEEGGRRPAASPPDLRSATSAGPSRPSATMYTVTFSESGLPGGFSWTVYLPALGSSSGGNVNQLPFQLTNGTYAFQVSGSENYLPNPASGNVTVAGGPVTVNVAYSLATLYNVTFAETGLPSGTSWGATVTFEDTRDTISHSSGGANLTFQLRDDSYSYALTVPSGYGLNATTGFFGVSGAPLRIPVPYHYGASRVVFTESGLPANTTWSVTFGNETNSSGSPRIDCFANHGNISFSVAPVGPYDPSPRSGYALVGTHGAEVDIAIQFAAPTWNLVIQETGLPNGTTWTIVVNGSSTFGSSWEISVPEPNGSYDYRVEGVPGYTANQYAGTLQIAGQDAVGSVAFAVTTYRVEFRETGLASGTAWTIGAGNESAAGSGSEIGLNLSNGTYTIRPVAVPGYTENVTTTIVVDGANSTVNVTFTGVPAPASTALAGLALWEWVAIAALVAAVGAIVAVLVLRRRR